jgi:hypothetical protein
MRRIIFIDPEPDPQRGAAPAPNITFNICGLLKMSITVTVFYLPIQIFNHFNNKKCYEKVALILRLTLVYFLKVGLLYSRVEAGAASKFFPGAGAA